MGFYPKKGKAHDRKIKKDQDGSQLCKLPVQGKI